MPGKVREKENVKKTKKLKLNLKNDRIIFFIYIYKCINNSWPLSMSIAMLEFANHATVTNCTKQSP